MIKIIIFIKIIVSKIGGSFAYWANGRGRNHKNRVSLFNLDISLGILDISGKKKFISLLLK